MNTRTQEHKNTVILGGGESGVGAALLAKKLGHHVFVSDKGSIAEKYKEELNKNAIPYEEGEHTLTRILEADEVIKSPGIPDKVPVIQAVVAKEIPVISEIEFASRHTDSTVIAITGSNGKTTTTKLTFHMLETAGFDVAIGGNVGYSFARLVSEAKKAYYVLEISSFQLDNTQKFRPDIAMILNITPDHLDRYDYKLENYINSKFKIIENQSKEDLFLYNDNNENIINKLKNIKLAPKGVAISEEMISGDHVVVGNSRFDMSKTQLRGKHNYMNALFAIHAAKALGAKDEAIQKGLETFVNVAHRMELVATIKDVEYINDSKATNVDSVFYALQAMTKPTIWIVGGQDKGNDYEPLFPFVREKVKAIVCMGADNSKLLQVFGDFGKPILEAGGAKEAVEMSTKLARSGDTILLSPACASFDLFKNYEDRGNQFKDAVLKLV
ncbi:MAG: UDP-N-acetylmuramoyl-L-alanine--D-glutamate ligase [Saprospiraceae bacterium]|nr:UDP-N-acetylmuramoyl-L-alanine--D-glutamate ligase [Saprospiraceae bacterium]